MQNEFIKPLDQYQREYDFRNIAVDDLTVFLAKQRNIDEKVAR